MKLVRGITRNVILTRRYAVKIPTFRSWKLFLHGLLANMQEREWWSTKDGRLCPVLWSIPGGWCVVMPRVQICDSEVNYEAFDGLPVDPKPCNFGYFRGRIVLVDYGS